MHKSFYRESWPPYVAVFSNSLDNSANVLKMPVWTGGREEEGYEKNVSIEVEVGGNVSNMMSIKEIK